MATPSKSASAKTVAPRLRVRVRVLMALGTLKGDDADKYLGSCIHNRV